jgi:hypothetical protein
MISAQSNSVIQEQLIEKYMSLPNQIWDDIINQALSNVNLLKDPKATRQLTNILKTNFRANQGKYECTRAIFGHALVPRMRKLYASW